MGQVTVSVNGRKYRMSCRDGEEKRVEELAAYIQGHVYEIKGGLKLVPEDRLYLMAAIMIADELFEAREELQKTLSQMAELRAHQIVDDGAYIAAKEVTRVIDSASARLDALKTKRSRTSP